MKKKLIGGNILRIQWSDGKIDLTAFPMEQPKLLFNEKGKMLNPKLRVIKINGIDKINWSEIEKDFNSERVVYLTKENVPEKITFDDTEQTIIFEK